MVISAEKDFLGSAEKFFLKKFKIFTPPFYPLEMVYSRGRCSDRPQSQSGTDRPFHYDNYREYEYTTTA